MRWVPVPSGLVRGGARHLSRRAAAHTGRPGSRTPGDPAWPRRRCSRVHSSASACGLWGGPLRGGTGRGSDLGRTLAPGPVRPAGKQTVSTRRVPGARREGAGRGASPGGSGPVRPAPLSRRLGPLAVASPGRRRLPLLSGRPAGLRALPLAAAGPGPAAGAVLEGGGRPEPAGAGGRAGGEQPGRGPGPGGGGGTRNPGPGGCQGSPSAPSPTGWGQSRPLGSPQATASRRLWGPGWLPAQLPGRDRPALWAGPPPPLLQGGGSARAGSASC